ncbi:MAG: carbonic anhydrase family protein [Nitrosospira sp.]|nr:carbonic anhydrase family protein [Nitrosospira sp.]
MTIKFQYTMGITLAVCALATLGTARAAVHYFGDSGPAHWGEIDPHFQACSSGEIQSPVDFRRAPQYHELAIDYGTTTGEIFNVGHEVKIATEGNNTLTLDGVTYKLVQFHFHIPSEHTVNGRGYDMEMHLVHQSADGKILVLAVFMERGKNSGALAPIFENLPDDINAHHPLDESFNPATLLPESRANYRYVGSLTTPPCNEPLQWIVMAEPVTISNEDMAQYAELIPYSARPVQRELK